MSSSDNVGGSAPAESDEELTARLMRFYAVDSLLALIHAQDRHIHKLQTGRQPQLCDDFPRVPREG